MTYTRSTPFYRQAPVYGFQTRIPFYQEAEPVKPEPEAEPVRYKPTAEQVEVNRQFLEQRLPRNVVRQHYARHLAGKGKSASIQDIDHAFHNRAALEEEEVVYQEMAEVWTEFKRK